jgi:cyanophycinase
MLWIGLIVLATGAPEYQPPRTFTASKGTVMAIGGGKLPAEVRAKFVALAGGAQAKVVVIPTASADADRADQAESFLADWRAAKVADVQLLHTRDRKRADADDFVAPLQTATAVWISGGDQNKLVAAYRGTAVERAVQAVLERGGIVGGTSAGAAVQSTPMIEGGTTEARFGPGWNLHPGCILDQHFSQRQRQTRLEGVLGKCPGYVGVGIDEATAWIVTGRTATVLGAGTVTVYAGPKPQIFKNGAQADVWELRTAALRHAGLRGE